MTTKTKNIIGWVLAGLLGVVFIGSGVGKLTAGEEGAKMAQEMGLTATSLSGLAILEIISVLLFIYPRTGILGTLLLAAYMGGAIATHLEHGQSIIAPCVIQAVIWIVALFRFPELGSRLFNQK